MEINAKSMEPYSLTEVIAQALVGLNRVELYLEDAVGKQDWGAVRWLEETKSSYQQILGAAQEFVVRSEKQSTD